MWEALSALSAVATTLILAGSLIFAWAQLRQAKEQRQQQIRPYVVADFEPTQASRQFFNFTIENLGLTVARDVQISFDRTPNRTVDSEDGSFLESSLMIKGIPTLPPRKKISTFWESLVQIGEADARRPYRVTLTYYADGRDEPYSDEYILDLGMYWGLGYIEERTIHDAAKSLQAIEKSIDPFVKLEKSKRR